MKGKNSPDLCIKNIHSTTPANRMIHVIKFIPLISHPTHQNSFQKVYMHLIRGQRQEKQFMVIFPVFFLNGILRPTVKKIVNPPPLRDNGQPNTNAFLNFPLQAWTPN